MLAFLLAFFNQMSGINAIMYFAPRIFEMAGYSSDSAMFQAVSVGVTNLVFTIIAMSVIDFFGRKKLLITGSLGMILFLGIVGLNFLSPNPGGTIVLVSLLGFIAFFGLSQGAVIWVYIAEVFPNRVRAKGQAFGSFSHWFMAALISWLFPVIAEYGETGGGIAFLVFSVSMMVQFFVVKIWFPETKGKSLEEIQKEMVTE
jgi:MFS family permease